MIFEYQKFGLGCVQYAKDTYGTPLSTEVLWDKISRLHELSDDYVEVEQHDPKKLHQSVNLQKEQLVVENKKMIEGILLELDSLLSGISLSTLGPRQELQLKRWRSILEHNLNVLKKDFFVEHETVEHLERMTQTISNIETKIEAVVMEMASSLNPRLRQNNNPEKQKADYIRSSIIKLSKEHVRRSRARSIAEGEFWEFDKNLKSHFLEFDSSAPEFELEPLQRLLDSIQDDFEVLEPSYSSPLEETVYQVLETMEELSEYLSQNPRYLKNVFRSLDHISELAVINPRLATGWAETLRTSLWNTSRSLDKSKFISQGLEPISFVRIARKNGIVISKNSADTINKLADSFNTENREKHISRFWQVFESGGNSVSDVDLYHALSFVIDDNPQVSWPESMLSHLNSVKNFENNSLYQRARLTYKSILEELGLAGGEKEICHGYLWQEVTPTSHKDGLGTDWDLVEPSEAHTNYEIVLRVPNPFYEIKLDSPKFLTFVKVVDRKRELDTKLPDIEGAQVYAYKALPKFRFISMGSVSGLTDETWGEAAPLQVEVSSSREITWGEPNILNLQLVKEALSEGWSFADSEFFELIQHGSQLPGKLVDVPANEAGGQYVNEYIASIRVKVSPTDIKTMIKFAQEPVTPPYGFRGNDFVQKAIRLNTSRKISGETTTVCRIVPVSMVSGSISSGIVTHAPSKIISTAIAILPYAGVVDSIRNYKTQQNEPQSSIVNSDSSKLENFHLYKTISYETTSGKEKKCIVLGTAPDGGIILKKLGPKGPVGSPFALAPKGMDRIKEVHENEAEELISSSHIGNTHRIDEEFEVHFEGPDSFKIAIGKPEKHSNIQKVTKKILEFLGLKDKEAEERSKLSIERLTIDMDLRNALTKIGAGNVISARIVNLNGKEHPVFTSME